MQSLSPLRPRAGPEYRHDQIAPHDIGFSRDEFRRELNRTDAERDANMSIIKRKRLLIDPKVQGALAVRVVSYWCLCLLTLTIGILIYRIVIGGPARVFYTHFDDMWFHFGPAVVGSFLLLPLVVFDILRTSNRFVGPLYRLRADMRKLARGEKVTPIRFRDGDFWHDIAEEFNAMVARFELELDDKAEPAATIEFTRPAVSADIQH